MIWRCGYALYASCEHFCERDRKIVSWGVRRFFTIVTRASSCSTSAWGNQLELLDWFWAYSVSSLTYMSAGSRIAHLDGYLRVLEADK